MDEPSSEERAKERAIAFALVNDVICDAGLVTLAIATGSLTLLGESARALLMLALLFYSYWILKSVHRGRLFKYEFGVIKLEHFATLLLGLSLLFGAVWLTQMIVETIFAERQGSTPKGLAFAALFNAINAFFNTINWLAIRNADHGHQTEAFRAQLQARFVMMASSLILQITLTAAALSQDTFTALILDCLGASFVCLLMVRNGVLLIRRSLPILLDLSASPEQCRQILAEVEKTFATSEIHSLRTRCLTSGVIAELVLKANNTDTLADLNFKRDSIEAELRSLGHAVDLEITPQPSAILARNARQEAGARKATTTSRTMP